MKGYATITLNEDTLVVSVDSVPCQRAPDLATLQAIVGGLIEPMFTVTSPCGGGRLITGYVNEEGAINGMQTIGVVARRGGLSPWCGNMVITALDNDGNTQSMNATEGQWFLDRCQVLPFIDGHDRLVIVLTDD